jgi:hypothetical protein
LTTSGSTAGTPRLGSTTPVSPAAVAVRRIMPTLAGLVIWSSTSTATSGSASDSRNASSGRIRGATTSASTPWSWRPLPASTLTRCADARRTGTPRPAAASMISRTAGPRAFSASTTLSTASRGSASASSTGLRPYTVTKRSFGDTASGWGTCAA